MKTTKRVRITALVALIAAVAGVVVAHGSAARRAAQPEGRHRRGEDPDPPELGGAGRGRGSGLGDERHGADLAADRPGRRTRVVARTPIASKNACTDLPGSCGEAAAGNGALWIARMFDDSVLRIDPRDQLAGGDDSRRLASRRGSRRRRVLIWVVNRGRPQRLQDRPRDEHRSWRRSRIGSVPCCSDDMAVAADAGAVWVSVPSAASVVRIDPGTNTVVARVQLAQTPCAFLAAGGGAVWSAGGHCAWFGHAHQRPDEQAGRSGQGDVGAGRSRRRLRFGVGGRPRRAADRAGQPEDGADCRPVGVAEERPCG